MPLELWILLALVVAAGDLARCRPAAAQAGARGAGTGRESNVYPLW